MCGVTNIFSSSKNFIPFGGSYEKTSVAAEKSLPLLTASYNASSSTRPPLAQFTNTAPSFIISNCFLAIIPLVSSVSGVWSVIISAWESTSSKVSHNVTPKASALDCLTYGS